MGRHGIVACQAGLRCAGARIGLLALLVGAGATLVWAQPSPSEAQPYRVAPGDRIAILVFGQSDLSGETVVDGGAAVTVPLLGSVSVKGLNVREIEQRLAQRFSDGYVQKPVVSVRLIEPRPLYVVGDVKASGSYPYRYGVSAMAAIALAGGFPQLDPQSQSVLRSDFLAADERLRTLELARAALVARRIRLEAQRDGRQSLDFSEIAGQAGKGEPLEQVLKGESQMHAFQMASLRDQVEMLQRQEPRLKAGQQFLKDQLAAETRQLELIQQHLVDYNSLLSSGLARRYTGIELQREEARNRGNIARFSGDIANVEIAVGELGIRIQEVRDAFQRRVRTDLQDTLLKIAETDAALPAARSARELRLSQLGGQAEEGAQPRRSLSVTRMGEQGSTTFPVADDTQLEPGDILRVDRRRERDRPGEIAAVPTR